LLVDIRGLSHWLGVFRVWAPRGVQARCGGDTADGVPDMVPVNQSCSLRSIYHFESLTLSFWHVSLPVDPARERRVEVRSQFWWMFARSWVVVFYEVSCIGAFEDAGSFQLAGEFQPDEVWQV